MKLNNVPEEPWACAGAADAGVCCGGGIGRDHFNGDDADDADDVGSVADVAAAAAACASFLLV